MLEPVGGQRASPAPAGPPEESPASTGRPGPGVPEGRPLAPPGLLVAVVAAVGAATLGAEITAARLLAPWFGDSTFIWANTIAVVLLGLAVGAAWGGRRAERDPTPAGMAAVCGGAAVLLALLPLVATPILRVSVAAFSDIAVGAFVVSLLSSLVLCAVPVALLGAVSPYAVRLAVTGTDRAGRTAGRLSAAGTGGSLVGTFLAALVLIPELGTRRSFALLALLPALAAVGLLLASRRGAVSTGRGPRRPLPPVAAGVGLVAALLVLVLPQGTVKATDGARVLADAETEYQYARVLQDDRGTRTLELNEGQAIHSLRRPGTVLTGDYWDEPLVLPLLRGRPPERVALLGNAGGTTARAYRALWPRTDVDAVEIDGELTELGERFFGLRPDARLSVSTMDARPFLLDAPRGGYDAIVVDAYRQPYIPFYLATREFFSLVASRLAPDGVLLINVGHPDGDDRLEQTLTRTVRTALPEVARDPVRDTNTVLVASRRPIDAARLRTTPGVPEALRPTAAAAAQRLGPGLRGGSVWTDDRAPVEWLIDSSIVQVAAGG